METTRRTVPREVDAPSGPTPTQAEANALALALTGERKEPFEVEPMEVVEADPPTPTQSEANELKIEAAGHDPDLVAPPVNKDVPHVTGDAVVGGVLTATMGNWDGMQAEPHSYSYQWMQDDHHAGLGQSGETYVVSDADAGHSITCVVTAVNAVGSTSAPPSNAVAIPPAARAAPARAEPAAPEKK